MAESEDNRSTEEILRELQKDGMVYISGYDKDGEPQYSLTSEGHRYAMHIMERMRKK